MSFDEKLKNHFFTHKSLLNSKGRNSSKINEKCDFPTFHQSPYRYPISSSEVCLVLFGTIKTRIKPYIMYTATSDRFQYTFVKSPFSPWKMAILGYFWQNPILAEYAFFTFKRSKIMILREYHKVSKTLLGISDTL